MGASTFLLQLLNGVQFGVLLFLLASGLTLTFGIMNVINLAHGSFFMIGAYLTYEFATHMGLPLAVAMLGAIASVVVIGTILEWFTLAPLVNRGHLDQVLLTYGLILIFDELATIIWGKDVQPAEIPRIFRGSVNVFSLFDYPLYRLVIIAVGLLTAFGLYLLISRTRLGMIVRAGTVDRNMVRALGIPVNSIFSIVFGIGAALAALGGIVASPVLSISPEMGDRIIIIAFVVVVIGGIGSIRGAFIGALLVGLVDTFGKVLFPSFSSLGIYLLMAAVLIWRPEGLFGAPAR
ncbi:MAG: branched-chain amino acid ABC transporter permease [Rhodomicrobium sp.]